MPFQRQPTRRGRRLAAGFLACALFAVTAPAASALVVHNRSGHFFGVGLHRGISDGAIPGSVAAQQGAARPRDNGQLSYHGGPVLQSSAAYLIFWIPSGERISATSQSLMQRYFTDVAAGNENDDVYGVTRQYTDATGFAGDRQSFDAGAQTVIDTQPYPSSGASNCPGSTYPTCLTDAQLQQELMRLIAAQNLPTDGPAGASELPQDAPIYFIVLPGDVDVCASGLGCASNTFCAYHSSTTDGSNTLLYAAMPMLPAENNPKACQADGNTAVQTPNGDRADVVIGDLSHEDNETISDPLGTSWYDTSSGNEEADNCAITGSFSPGQDTNQDAFKPTLGGSAGAGTLYDQLINGDQYYTQSEWSNGDPGCEMQPSAGTINASFSAPSGPNPAGSSLTFDPSASTSTYAISSATWDFGDGSATAFDRGGPTSVSHTYAAGGTYTVTLTLVDIHGNLQTATRQVTVENSLASAAGSGLPPVAGFVVTTRHPAVGVPVRFDGSSSSARVGSIASYSWRFGDGSTAHGARVAHTYARAGRYRVSLTILSSSGLNATVNHAIVVVRGGRIKKISILRERGSALLKIVLTGAGRLSVGSRRFVIARAKTIKVWVTPTAAQRSQLELTNHLQFLVLVAFRPNIGLPTKRRVSITLPG